MTVHYTDDAVTLHHGDCLDVLRTLPDSSVDAVVTDPPYGLEFMGKGWDSFRTDDPGSNRHRGDNAGNHGDTANNSGAEPFGRVAYGGGKRPSTNRCTGCGKRDQFRNPHPCDDQPQLAARWVKVLLDPHAAPPTMLAFGEWCRLWATECLRVLKPGGHLLAFGGTRTWHRLACAVEDAGFEVRDSIAWLYGSGFPKSLDVSKAIDKAAGAEHDETAPATPDAQQWAGWGTALKPAFEPIVVGRKPLVGTVAGNVLAHGTGALNIAATRVRPPGGAGSSPGDSSACTCPSLGDDRTTRTPSTQPQGSSAAAPAGRSDLPASAAEHAQRPPAALGSRAGYPISPRSDGARVLHVQGDALGAAPSPAGAGAPRGPHATPPRTRARQSMPCPQHTATDVETAAGRWPANVVLDDTQAAELDRQAPNTGAAAPVRGLEPSPAVSEDGVYGNRARVPGAFHGDSGGASRFFPTFRYEAKAPTAERPRIGGGRGAIANQRCRTCGRSRISGSRCECPTPDWEVADESVVAHPTVKPLDLMRWLVRLVTPPGGVVLEPFAGSGTTAEACVLEGFRCIAIEREADYLPLIVQRLSKPLQPGLFG